MPAWAPVDRPLSEELVSVAEADVAAGADDDVELVGVAVGVDDVALGSKATCSPLSTKTPSSC
jgi:hypothetical protein